MRVSNITTFIQCKSYNGLPKREDNRLQISAKNTCDTVSFGNGKKQEQKSMAKLMLEFLKLHCKEPYKFLLDEAIENVDLIKDKVVLDEIYKKAIYFDTHIDSFNDSQCLMFKDLVNGVNCADNLYTVYQDDLANTSKRYYKKLKEVFPKDAQWIRDNIHRYSKSTKASDIFKTAGKFRNNNARFVRDFLDEQRFWSLKTFFTDKYADNEEFNDYLYKNYYLKQKSFPKYLEKKLLKCNETYGTKMFLPMSDIKPEMLDNILNELKTWKQTAQKQNDESVKFPKVLDLSLIKEWYLDGKAGSCGTSGINLYLGNNNDFCRNLRHEMIHLNTKADFKNTAAIGSEKYENEMRNAGVEEYLIEYSRENGLEFLAVAGTYDTTKYSQEFKKALLDLGMPEFVFNLEPVKS